MNVVRFSSDSGLNYVKHESNISEVGLVIAYNEYVLIAYLLKDFSTFNFSLILPVESRPTRRSEDSDQASLYPQWLSKSVALHAPKILDSLLSIRSGEESL